MARGLYLLVRCQMGIREMLLSAEGGVFVAIAVGLAQLERR